MTFPIAEGAKGAVERAVARLGRVVYLDEESSGERRRLLRESEVLLAWDLKAELSDEEWGCLERVELVQLLDAGVDRAPFALMPPTALVAGNAGAYADAVAEHALALVLALAKRLPLRHEQLSRGQFDSDALSLGLRGQACAILGYGGVGRSVARMVRAMGMRVFAVNRSGVSTEPVDFVGTLAELDYVLAEAAVVIVSLPLSRRTRNLIGARELQLMKPDAILVNVARAGILQQEPLYEHLRRRPRFMVGIDVWWEEPHKNGRFDCDYPFLGLPNLIGSAHVASNVEGWFEAGVAEAARNVRRHLMGESLTGVVRREEYET